MINRFLIAACLIVTMSSCAHVTATTGPPTGWRYPTESDYINDWSDFRAEIPEPYHARADFDGNGIKDEAWILIRNNNNEWGLFVVLSKEIGTQEVIELDHITDKNFPPQRMGIQIVAPGDYETACGKGYFECGKDEPEILHLDLPGIDYFVYESANSFFWWDGKAKRFRRTWISD